MMLSRKTIRYSFGSKMCLNRIKFTISKTILGDSKFIYRGNHINRSTTSRNLVAKREKHNSMNLFSKKTLLSGPTLKNTPTTHLFRVAHWTS
jgi:hypothetical protein